MNNILALLAGILLLGGILLIFYPQLHRRANPLTNGSSTTLISNVLEMDPDTERRIPLSKIMPPTSGANCSDPNAIGT